MSSSVAAAASTPMIAANSAVAATAGRRWKRSAVGGRQQHLAMDGGLGLLSSAAEESFVVQSEVRMGRRGMGEAAVSRGGVVSGTR